MYQDKRCAGGCFGVTFWGEYIKMKKRVNIELHADELDLTSSECKAT